MTMLRFEPFRGFESVMKKIGDIAADLEKGVVVEKGSSFNPRVDMYEDDKNIYLFAEIPGMAKEDVQIKLSEERILSLKGSKTRKGDDEGKAYIRSERRFGEFTRNFVLPDNIETDKIKAAYNNGMLEIIIAKKEPEPPKEIEISIE